MSTRILLIRRAAAVAVAALAVLAVSPASAAGEFEKLPGDTWFAVAVHDMNSVRAKWESHPMRDAIQSPELEAIRTKAVAMWEEMSKGMQEELNVDPEVLLQHVEGFAALTFSDFEVEDFDEGPTTISLVLGMGPEKQQAFDADFQKILDKSLPEDARRSLDTFKGAKVYRIEFEVTPKAEDGAASEPQGITMDYAFAGPGFVMSATDGQPGQLQEILNAFGGGTEASLSASEAYQKVSGQFPAAGDVAVWLDLPRIMAGVTDKMGAEDPEGLSKFKAIGLHGLGAAMMTISLSPDGTRSRAAMCMPAEKTGILKMLYAGGANRIETAKVVPADAIAYNSFTLDVGTLWTSLNEMLQAVEPQATFFVQGFLQNVKTQYEFDVEADLLSHLKGEHATYMRSKEDGATPAFDPTNPIAAAFANSQVMLFGLENGQVTVDAVNRLFTKMTGEPQYMPFEKSEVAGAAIWAQKEDPAMPMPVRPCLALLPSRLIFSTNMAETQQAVRAAGGEAGASLASQPGFQTAIEGVDRENLRVLSYESSEVLAEQVDQVRSMLSFVQENFAEQQTPITSEDIPAKEWFQRWFGDRVTTLHLSPDALVMDEKLLMKP